MERAKLGAMVAVPKSLIDLEQVKEDLTIANAKHAVLQRMGFAVGAVSPDIKLYRETQDYIHVPRHYPLPDGVEVEDTRSFPQFQGYVKSLITLRPKQVAPCNALIDDCEDKIISLSCGFGKSVIALHAAATDERFPLLVVVNTKALAEQWVKEINKWLNVHDVGRVYGGQCSWKNKSIAVALLHTLTGAKTFPSEFYEYWRLVIFDELHHCAADTFSRACHMFPAERWGLSATVDRSDGMEGVFKAHVGEIVYKDLSQPLVPKFHFVKTGVVVRPDQIQMKNYGYGRSAGSTYNMLPTNCIPRYVNIVCKNEGRTRLVLGWVEKKAREGRKILVLGERVKHLMQMHKQCDFGSKALFIGGMSPEAGRQALKAQVVFATQHLAKEGLDSPALDTVFILVPYPTRTRMQQTVGRIQREFEGKMEPEAFVFVDACDVSEKYADCMKTWCRSQKFPFVDVTQAGQLEK